MDSATQKRMTAALKTAGKYTYIILSILIVGGIAYILYNTMQRPIAGILFFMGGVLAAYFYYVKWFVIPAQRPDWPHYQTICPDYLTPISPGYTIQKRGGKDVAVPKEGGKIRCVDFVGVSRNGRLRRADPAKLASQLNNPEFVYPVWPGEKINNVKYRLNQYGLSWITMFGDN